MKERMNAERMSKPESRIHPTSQMIAATKNMFFEIVKGTNQTTRKP